MIADLLTGLVGGFFFRFYCIILCCGAVLLLCLLYLPESEMAVLLGVTQMIAGTATALCLEIRDCWKRRKSGYQAPNGCHK